MPDDGAAAGSLGSPELDTIPAKVLDPLKHELATLEFIVDSAKAVLSGDVDKMPTINAKQLHEKIKDVKKAEALLSLLIKPTQSVMPA